MLSLVLATSKDIDWWRKAYWNIYSWLEYKFKGVLTVAVKLPLPTAALFRFLTFAQRNWFGCTQTTKL